VDLMLAHIAGIPIEEAVVMAIPALGAAYVAIMASLRARRESWKRGD
jgi:glycerol kinase